MTPKGKCFRHVHRGLVAYCHKGPNVQSTGCSPEATGENTNLESRGKMCLGHEH